MDPSTVDAETSTIFREATMLADGVNEAAHYFEVPMMSHRPINETANSMQQTQINGTQKAHQWFVQHHQFQDSGIQSMENSKAPSIVSMNNVGKTAGDEGKCYLVNESIDSASVKSTTTPVLQAVSSLPSEAENAKRVLPELIPLLEDSDEEVACRALEMVIHIAKLDSAQPFNDPVITQERIILALSSELKRSFENKRIIRLTLCALFHISNRTQGMQLILQSLEQRPRGFVSFLFDLIRCTGIAELACFKYALLILHNLMTERNVSKRVVEFIREQKAMSVITECLNEGNEKLLSIIVDIVQILCEKCSEQKAFFIALNGPTLLCNILSWARYENLLWRTTRLLKSVSVYDPQRIVDSGAYDVLPLNMDHASQRLVSELLSCTRDLSDMSTNKLDISYLLSRLVQLLGTNDMEIRQLCIQSLANFSANNRRNKEFLYQMDFVGTLRHVLYDTEALMEEMNTSRQMIEVLEDIQETALTALRNLYSGHSFEQEVQQNLLMNNGAEFFLRKLYQMRPTLVRRSLLILSKAANLDSNIPIFRRTSLQTGVETQTNFAERLIYILFVSVNKMKQSKTIEKVNLSELMNLAMLILQRLSRDEVIMRQVTYYLKEYPVISSVNSPVLLPIYILSFSDDSLVQTAITLINELIEMPEVAIGLSTNREAILVLERILANEILRSVHSVSRHPIPHHSSCFRPHRTVRRDSSECRTGSTRTHTPNQTISEFDVYIENDSGYHATDVSTDFVSSYISPPTDDYYTNIERYQSMNITSVSTSRDETADGMDTATSSRMSTPRSTIRSQQSAFEHTVDRSFS
ncbi:hypothetical protein M3Y96_00149700 [Aphelenchoides besseyi]|nr:hypothetical protein M3Y96_00149700 [Aphelenchoides besseyi]